jgi:hypothetical protein
LDDRYVKIFQLGETGPGSWALRYRRVGDVVRFTLRLVLHLTRRLCRLQQPWSLRHEMSTRTLGSWVRILLVAWMYVYFSVFLSSCVGSDLATSRSPVQEVLPTICNIHSSRIILNGYTPEGLICQRKKTTTVEIQHFNHYCPGPPVAYGRK